MKQKCKRCNQSIDDSIAKELRLCQECWEEEADKDWWREVERLKIDFCMGVLKGLGAY